MVLQFGGLRITVMLFADDGIVCLCTSTLTGLDQLAVECEAARMRISTSKSEVMVLSRKPVDCPLWVGNEFSPQVKEFEYLGFLFTSEGTIERETGQRIGETGAVLLSPYCTVVTKSELSCKARL